MKEQLKTLAIMAMIPIIMVLFIYGLIWLIASLPMPSQFFTK